MYVAIEGGRVAGFMLLLETPESIVVDLIAVDPEFQGRGLGRALLAAAASRDRIIFAGTQQANFSSCRLYEKNGFLISGEEFVYHLHR